MPEISLRTGGARLRRGDARARGRHDAGPRFPADDGGHDGQAAAGVQRRMAPAAAVAGQRSAGPRARHASRGHGPDPRRQLPLCEPRAHPARRSASRGQGSRCPVPLGGMAEARARADAGAARVLHRQAPRHQLGLPSVPAAEQLLPAGVSTELAAALGRRGHLPCGARREAGGLRLACGLSSLLCLLRQA